MTISGIGPKLAVTILSGGSVEDLVGAIKRSDLPRLTAIPGVGRKTAERIILELRNKVTAEQSEEAVKKMESDADIVETLTGLGYRREEFS